MHSLVLAILLVALLAYGGEQSANLLFVSSILTGGYV